jgi:hypothetical protein
MSDNYCSYIFGGCVLGYGSKECRDRNPVARRNCRQKIEREKEDECLA